MEEAVSGIIACAVGFSTVLVVLLALLAIDFLWSKNGWH